MSENGSRGLAVALEAALEAADHLTASDAASIAVARTLAASLDATEDNKLPYNTQVYMQSLKALNLDPASRMAAGVKEPDAKGKIADMKAERDRRRKSA